MNEVLCVGAGRGGHGVLPRLAAGEVRQLAILDDDVVEPANLPNLRLDARWVGWPKAKELAASLAARHRSVVRWANVKFTPDLVDPRSPFADMIFRQRLVLALTDDLAAQLALSVTAAKLEIPLIATRVFANAGGDVFAQLDVERDPCLACFTAHLRRNDRRVEPLRGRDLPVGAGDRVDDFAAEVALTLLSRSPERLRSLFSPHRRFGTPCAWEIDAAGGNEPTPVFFDRDPGCPVCGERRRRQPAWDRQRNPVRQRASA